MFLLLVFFLHACSMTFIAEKISWSSSIMTYFAPSISVLTICPMLFMIIATSIFLTACILVYLKCFFHHYLKCSFPSLPACTQFLSCVTAIPILCHCHYYSVSLPLLSCVTAIHIMCHCHSYPVSLPFISCVTAILNCLALIDFISISSDTTLFFMHYRFQSYHTAVCTLTFLLDR